MDRLMTHAAFRSAHPGLAWCGLLWLVLRDRYAAARSDERGMTTETVIITAGLAALAVTIVAIIAARVRDRANQIP